VKIEPASCALVYSRLVRLYTPAVTFLILVIINLLLRPVSSEWVRREEQIFILTPQKM